MLTNMNRLYATLFYFAKRSDMHLKTLLYCFVMPEFCSAMDKRWLISKNMRKNTKNCNICPLLLILLHHYVDQGRGRDLR